MRGRRRMYGPLAGVLLLAWSLALAGPSAAAEPGAGLAPVSAWTASPQGPAPAGFPAAPLPLGEVFPGNQARNQTLRLIVHSATDGEWLRVRLSNLVGTQWVTFGSVFVGVCGSGAGLEPRSNRPVRFAGQPSVMVPPGGEVLSDPVDLALLAEQDLAVSLFVAGASGPLTWHAKALTTSYATGPDTGDRAADEDGAAFDHPIRSWFWLDEVQAYVAADRASGTVVALGDSITDGTASTVDGNDRWPDALARRLRAAGIGKSVANQGIGGNRVVAVPGGPVLVPDDPNGPCAACGYPAVERLDRDVLARPNLSEVILFEGVNDIGAGASAAEIIAGMQQLVERVHDRGVRIYGATITPYGGSLYSDRFPDAIRQEVNAWLRTAAPFDALLDFDAVARDPDDPSRIAPWYDPGDHIHLNPDGYAALADSIPLELFAPPGEATEQP